MKHTWLTFVTKKIVHALTKEKFDNPAYSCLINLSHDFSNCISEIRDTISYHDEITIIEYKKLIKTCGNCGLRLEYSPIPLHENKIITNM